MRIYSYSIMKRSEGENISPKKIGISSGTSKGGIRPEALEGNPNQSRRTRQVPSWTDEEKRRKVKGNPIES